MVMSMTGDTTITISLLMAIIGCIISVSNFIDNKRRSHKGEIKSDTVEMTTAIVKMESIKDSIKDLRTDMQQSMKDIKSDVSSIKNDMNDFRERIVAVEQSAKAAHHRLDQMEIIKHYDKGD